jgi:hypothetical protein
MLYDILAVLGLALLCAGWIWLQQVIQKADPENPGLDRKCGDCGCSDKKERCP